jgi:UDP-glucose 4-epimerase
MSQKHIIVTGGAGFIGSHVTDRLLEEGHRVVVIDDLSSGARKNVDDRAALHVMNIRSKEAARLVEEVGPDILYHLAAQMDVRKSVADPAFDAEVNILGALNLLEAGRKAGLRRVVFSSTGGAIYGEQNLFPADETHPEQPLSPYGITKLSLEKYLYYYHDAFGLDVTCLRYANVYGPRQNAHGEAGVVAIFSRKLLAGERPTIFGDGENTRDFVYVDDVVDANAAAQDIEGFRIYNIGTGVETTINQLYETLNRITGAGLDPRYGDAKPGEQRRSSITAQKISDEIGVHPSVDLKTGLNKTVEWFGRQDSHK